MTTNDSHESWPSNGHHIYTTPDNKTSDLSYLKLRKQIWLQAWLNPGYYLVNVSDLSCFLEADCADSRWHVQTGLQNSQTDRAHAGACRLESLSTMSPVEISQTCGGLVKQELLYRGQHHDVSGLKIRTRYRFSGLIYQLSVTREEFQAGALYSCTHFSCVLSSADCCDGKQTVAKSPCSLHRYRCRSAKFRIMYRFNKYELFDITFYLPPVCVQLECPQTVLPTRPSHEALQKHCPESIHSCLPQQHGRLVHSNGHKDAGGSVHSYRPQQSDGSVHSYRPHQPCGSVHSHRPQHLRENVHSYGPQHPWKSVHSHGPQHCKENVHTHGPQQPDGSVHSHGPEQPDGSVHSHGPQQPDGSVHSYTPEDAAVSPQIHNTLPQAQGTARKPNVFVSNIPPLPRYSLSKFTLPPKLSHRCSPSSPPTMRSHLAHDSSPHYNPQRSLWSLITMLVLLHLSFDGLSSVGAQGLIGTISTCDNEGEEVQIPNITDNPCIKCVCKNRQVECETKRCKNVEGCHAILFDQPSTMCCEVCKGCRYQGAHYDSGDSWRDKKDPCKQYACRAGVVSVSSVQCFSHCYHPVPVPGQCCPVCEGCLFRGHTYGEMETFKLATDVCTTCTCKNGKLTCEREQCPVLNCPPEVIFQPKNECCPQCKGQRKVFDLPTQCYFAKSVYKRNQQFQPDKCSTCICKSGTSVCETAACPALDCPEAERHALDDSQCCVRCWEKKPCLFDGKHYKHQEEWKPSVCMQCSCEDGVSYCQRERCSNSLWCPQGYRLLLTENECCPKCIEHDAVCSVFGDPHYRTFDGLMYSFQGTCKYILARDCSKNDFLIKVRNGVRFSSGFAWTQMLVVFIFEHRISLLQNSVVKVDKRRARLPYSRPGMFSIVKEGELVKLTTTLGLDVTWDGDSFLEVTVTTKYKYRLCGLCGNYNGIKSDDLIGSDGTIYTSGNEYGHSWRIGSTRSCKLRPHFQETHPLCERDYRAKLRAHRVCSVFYSRAFTKCRQKVSADVYVSSCITDMCDCPEGRYCACEAIRAYTSRCTRSGFLIIWDKMRNCQEPESCPESSVKVDCADLCPKTCEDPHAEEPCPDLCLRGCQCEKGKVWHKGGCVPPTECTYRT